MKYCKDCKFFEPADKLKTPELGKPLEYEIDYFFSRCTRKNKDGVVDHLTPVSGQLSTGKSMIFCNNERRTGPIESWMPGKCGIRARYFQPKE